PREEWSNDVVNAALDDIAELHALGEQVRAAAAFRRWFEGLSPAEVAIAGSRSSEDTDHTAADARRSLMMKMGQVSVAVGRLPPRSYGVGTDDAEASFSSGLLAGMAECARAPDFISTLRRIERFYIRDAQKLLTSLVDCRAWTRCKRFLYSIAPKDDHPWPYRLQAAVVASLTGDPRLRAAWVAPLLS